LIETIVLKEVSGMNNSIDNVEAPVRENRLGAITGYQGTIRDLTSRASCLGLRNRERCFSQMSACSSGCAQGYLSRIRDAAIVVHAPLGCAAILRVTIPPTNGERRCGDGNTGISASSIPT